MTQHVTGKTQRVNSLPLKHLFSLLNGGFVHISKLLLIAAFCWLFEGAASAQGMFVASLGNVYGGDALERSGTWALAIGGGGAHAIGSELEFAQTSHFKGLGGVESRVLTLMPSVFVAIPAGHVKPYGTFGFGFIRQRTETSKGSVVSNLSNNDVGYSVGGGVIVKFAKSAGIRGDIRHFQVRTSNGLSFQRVMLGIVLGG